MHSYLFYVELVSAPAFYSVPEMIQVRLLCRLPHCSPNEKEPNASILDLLSRLKRQNTMIFYHADGEQHVEPLVTPEIWDFCQRGGGFSRILNMTVLSRTSVLDIRIGNSNKSQKISNCPYQLGKLIKDQKLNCTFGRKDCQTDNEALDSEMREELQALCKSLDNIARL